MDGKTISSWGAGERRKNVCRVCRHLWFMLYTENRSAQWTKPTEKYSTWVQFKWNRIHLVFEVKCHILTVDPYGSHTHPIEMISAQWLISFKVAYHYSLHGSNTWYSNTVKITYLKFTQRGKVKSPWTWTNTHTRPLYTHEKHIHVPKEKSTPA